MGAGGVMIDRAPVQRLDGLTGLRFLAAAVVFVGHAQSLLAGPAADRTAWLTRPGYVGVSFFFLLSGFVLTWSWRGSSAFRFYRRRFARVYPAHIVMWGLVAALVASTHVNGGSAGGALAGVLLLQAWIPDQSAFYALNGVAWSLSAEAFFYLLFPLWIRAVGPLSPRARPLLLAALAGTIVVVAAVAAVHVPAAQLTGARPSGEWLWLLYNCPLTRFLEFAIGTVLALQVRDGMRLPGLRRWLLLAAAGYLACCVWTTTFDRVAVMLVPFCAVIVAVAGRDIDGTPTPFARRGLVRLGEWSFAFYLVHQAVLHTVGMVVPPTTSLGVGAGRGAAVLACSLLAAFALHRFVEVPFEARLSGRGRPAAAPRRLEPVPVTAP